MNCDICNVAMEAPACLLSTREVVTSKECWAVYLGLLLAQGMIRREQLKECLDGLVGQLSCSDTPWALCSACTSSLTAHGFRFRTGGEHLSPHGHALCRSSKPMEFLVLDEPAVVQALQAGTAAVAEILSE